MNLKRLNMGELWFTEEPVEHVLSDITIMQAKKYINEHPEIKEATFVKFKDCEPVLTILKSK